MEFPVKQVGILVLAIIVVLAIIIFLLVGVNAQTSAYENTSSFVLTNLTKQAEEAKSGVIIG